MAIDPLNAKIDEFVERSKALIGKEISERECWNTIATQDAIRHFAYGISDDNPLWLDPLYAAKTHWGRQLAPPTFLTSVLYPHLHGEPMEVPLSNLIGDLEFQWYSPIFFGDTFRAAAKITGIYESKDRGGRRLIYIFSETCYWNQHDVMVGKALGTMVRYALAENDLLLNRSIYQYTEEELKSIGGAQAGEHRRGQCAWATQDLEIGQELPILVRGPLTVGDLICWQAGIGPSYRGGALGYIDNLKAPHNAVRNPVTHWPVKYSQQHEDFLLSSQRGMPAPFDNGVMRFAWISPLLTNWMGDSGTLTRLSIQILEPNLYGDTTWYRGVVVGKSLKSQGTLLKVNVSGSNQLKVTTTKGTAEVFIPFETITRSQPGLHLTVRDFQGQQLEKPTSRFIHELFEAQVQKTPDGLALSFENEGLTYRALNQRTNQLADHLQSLGVGPEVSVGILMERSMDVIVAMLAILKSGGAYIFFDPEYPMHRMAFMLKDAQVRIILIQERLRTRLPPDTPTILVLDSNEKSFTKRKCENPVNVGSNQNLAYLMYTSGSTNQPKRVGVPHLSLCRYISALMQSFNIEPEDIYLQTASFAFSASTRQIFLPLCVGATLHIANTEQRHNPDLLYKLICSRQVTAWDTVPSVWRNCVETVFGRRKGQGADPINHSLRLILLTGEALDGKTIKQWKDRLDDNITILNLYSQTESAGTVSSYSVFQEGDNQNGIVPIGRPLKGTTIHLLHNDFTLVKAHETGHIYVGGRPMARGYLNRPDLTAERFVPNPYDNHPGGRMQNTGDLARYRFDGSMEWMGRSDQQVKLRGYRIELGEIEAVLAQHPAVREAVTVLRENAPGEKQLVAYVVPTTLGSMLEPLILRQYLQPLVPDYMVPAAFVLLDNLPLTPNGKVNRHALPEPDQTHRARATSFVPARTPLEELLTEIWQDLLKVEHIGVHDNFFALGGHSLSVTQVISRLRKILELDLPVRTIFEHPTVAQLAKEIDTQLATSFPDWPRDESPTSFCPPRT